MNLIIDFVSCYIKSGIKNTFLVPLLALSAIFTLSGITMYISNEFPIWNFIPFTETDLQNLIHYIQNSWVWFAGFTTTYAVLIVRKLRKTPSDYLDVLSITFASTSLLFASYLITGMMFFYALTNPIFVNGVLNHEHLQTILLILSYNVLARDLALNVEGQGGITGLIRKSILKVIKNL